MGKDFICVGSISIDSANEPAISLESILSPPVVPRIYAPTKVIDSTIISPRSGGNTFVAKTMLNTGKGADGKDNGSTITSG